MEALAEHDGAVCPGCGVHPSLAGKVSLQLEESVCQVCAATARTGRKIADRDEKHREKHKDAPAGAPLPSDGLHVHLRALSPQEAAERAKKAKGGPADG